MTETTANTAARASCWTTLDSPAGPLLLAATDEGLVNVVFHATAATTDRALEGLSLRLGTAPVGTGAEGAADAAEGAEDASAAASVVEHAAAELASYFEGGLREFTVPLDWSLSGGFNERVLRELLASVPYGVTAGYQDLADRVGEPGAARAVGMAMGSNPLPVVVPCHRIVESRGGLGGFGGGLETKRTLLALEGLLPQPLF